MNSLLGNNSNILMQAFGAMMRGESPKTFMQNLAKNNPQLQGMDFNNMEQTARNVCKNNNVDMNAKLNEIKSQLPK
jgi:hypothetical protein